MPQLKQIEASIELGTSNTKLKEYGARYSDGHVETFVAVPDTDMPFSIHLSTKHYIAPGIAFFVFMDGEYQCNRNKIGLKLPGDGVQPHEYETEFRLRQKEEKTSTGSFVAREWSFAKLNTVAADKAPSLNSDFVRNVGTIEIVAMRCRSASEEETPQKQTPSRGGKQESATPKPSSQASKVKPAKTPTPAPSRAPPKPASVASEEPFGGLFDGACDSMGMDGANDERPVSDSGRVDPQPPPGFFWDSARGAYRPKDPNDAGTPDALLDGASDIAPSARMRVKSFLAEEMAKMQTPQVDGNGEWQRGFGGGHQGHQQDDLRGDKYLGMSGRDRSDYKQFFRERGDTVSQTTKRVVGVGPTEGFICHTQAAADNVQNAPSNAKGTARFSLATQNKGSYDNTSAGLQMLADDLELVRQDLEQLNQTNPHFDTTGAWQDWRLMEAKLRRMRAERERVAAQPSVRHFVPAKISQEQQEALDDLSSLRMELRISAVAHPSLNVDRWLERFSKLEERIKSDPLWTKPVYEYVDEVSWLRSRRKQLHQRNDNLTKVHDTLCQLDSSYATGKIAKRLDEIRAEGMSTSKRVQELEAASANARATATPSQRHVKFRPGYDGASLGQNGNPVTPTQQDFWNKNAPPSVASDWQQVGDGSRKPGQQNDNGWGAPSQKGTFEHFPGEQLPQANAGTNGWEGPTANTWAGGQQQGNAVSGSQAGSRKSQDGWGGGWQQQKAGSGVGDKQSVKNAWQTSRASAGAGGGDWKTGASRQGGGANWAGGSQKGSQNGRGNDNWANNDGQDGGWGIQSNRNQGNDNGWGNTGRSSANKSQSGARRAARESISSNPKDLIKPYWKDWNKARSESLANDGKRREVAREVYTYPAAKLPAVPEVASATYGVQTGRGAEYNHLCRRPVYIDTMEKPYAVFSFKYRSKDKLKQITGLDVKSVDDDVKAVQKQVQKDKLMQMPKDQLIERLIKSCANKGGSQKAPSATGRQAWGDKPASDTGGWDKKSSAKSAAGDGGWGGNSQANGGHADWAASSHSKSKKSDTKAWGNDQTWGDNNDNGGGGTMGWDGQNETVQAQPKSGEPVTTPGGFKFDYAAFQDAGDKGAVAEAGNGPAGDFWGGNEDAAADNAKW